MIIIFHDTGFLLIVVIYHILFIDINISRLGPMHVYIPKFMQKSGIVVC